MTAKTESTSHDEQIAVSAGHPSMITHELTISPEPQSFTPATNTSQNWRMEFLELDLIVSDDELKVRVKTDQMTVQE